MAIETTFALIKPDAVARSIEGAIISKINESPLSIVAIKKLHLTREQAELFYAVHSERPFFEDLTSFISSGPLFALALEGENGVQTWRDLMGATNPADAAEGTVRAEFGTELGRNVTHGSDSLENAALELSIFFSQLELVR